MRKSQLFAVAAAIAFMGVAAGCGEAQQAQAPAAKSTAVVFDGARVIVGDGSAPIENATLVIDGGVITQVGAAGQVTAPEGATHVDVTGKTIMPAIIDTHVHFSQTPEGVTNDLKRRAYWGVSAAMSMGNEESETTLNMRGQKTPGMARAYTAWRGITRPEPGRTMAPFWVETEEEARAAVQQLAEKNVDIVKIWVDDRDDQFPKLTPELYGAIIDEAHMRNLRVTAHIFELGDAKGLLNAGLDAFAHGVRDMDVDDEFMTLVAANPNLVLNPNLPGRGVVSDVSWLQGRIPAEEMQSVEQGNTDNPQAQEAFGIQARNLARMNDAGVTIVLGTDGNVPWGPHQEMESMAAAGMTPMEVIVASTGDAAEFMRITDAGTLEAGKSADLIVLDANPADDITNTRTISSVYLYGQQVDRSAYP